MDSGRAHPERLLLPPLHHHQHPHPHFHPSSHRDQLFTSFISLVVFLFLLIVVLLLSPHVHGHEVGQEDDSIQPVDNHPDLYTEWDSESEHDTIQDRMDVGKRNRTIQVLVPRVKRVQKSAKVSKPVKSKKAEFELMSPREIRELHALLTGHEIVIKRKKSLKLPKPYEKISATRRGSGLDRQQQQPQRPRQPREPPVPVGASSRVESNCPWCEVSVSNAGSQFRGRPTFTMEATYSDSSISPDEDAYDRQIRFVFPESVPRSRPVSHPRKLGHFQSRTNGASAKNRVPLAPSVEYAADAPEQLQPQQHSQVEPHPPQQEPHPHHVVHQQHPTLVLEEVEPEAPEPVAIVTPGQAPETVYYQHVPSASVEAPVTDVRPQEQQVQEEDSQENPSSHQHYLKSTIEYEKQVLKQKRPVLKSKHPLLKHFPKFFSYLDQEDGLDQVPEDSDDRVKQPPQAPVKQVPAAPEEEEEGEAILIHPGQAARPAVPGVMPPPLPPPHPLSAVPPPPPLHPLAMVQPDLYDDGMPGHHYTPQLSTRRPLLVPSLRLGLRLAMPLRHPHHKVPTSMLNQIPEPDYKGFDPLPRKLGSKVVDRFYSANIVQDIGLVYAPKSLLSVKFENGAQLCLGNPLSVLDSFTMPSLSWPPVRAKSYHPHHLALASRPMQPLYTVIMLDPDIPLMDGQYVHWLQVNVPSPRKKGMTIVNYINPLPIIPAFGSIASPNHRYVFLVFAQTKVLPASKVKDYVAGKSTSFKLRDFVKFFGLETQPVAGNFFFGRLYVKTKIIC